jgi:uncharacterized membrane protein
MSKFALMVFTDEKKAYEALRALQELHAEGSLTVWGMDVLQREAGGKIAIVKRDADGPIGTGLGALVGGLVGLFGGPVGAAVGVAVGATAGGVRDLLHLGVSADFLAAVERDLAPGKFAVVAEISEEWIVPLDARMDELGAKVVREDRLEFAEDILEKRVNTRNARLAQLKSERDQRKQERAGVKAEAMMQQLLTKEIEDERRKLVRMAERSDEQLDSSSQELNAKIEALLAQASGASSEARIRIGRRMGEVRSEFAERQQKLERALKLTRQALRP